MTHFKIQSLLGDRNPRLLPGPAPLTCCLSTCRGLPGFEPENPKKTVWQRGGGDRVSSKDILPGVWSWPEIYPKVCQEVRQELLIRSWGWRGLAFDWIPIQIGMTVIVMLDSARYWDVKTPQPNGFGCISLVIRCHIQVISINSLVMKCSTGIWLYLPSLWNAKLHIKSSVTTSAFNSSNVHEYF